MPNDTNTLGNLMGGNLLNWMDVAAAISANRHCRRVVVTAAVNNVSFDRPIRLADIVIMKALDKDGNKLFHTTDRLDIMNKVDSDVLAKIAAAMVQSPTAYESKKN